MNARPLVEIGDPLVDRYATLNLIAGWRHDLVRAACYLVVGAGALGNEVLKNLALLGAGRIVVVDTDVVEAANLSRSVLFRMEDRGQPKASVAAARVHALNGDVDALAVHGDVARDVGAGVYRRVDAVFGCLDNRAARLAVSHACFATRTPWVDGALEVLLGSVRVCVPPDTACYECTMSQADYRQINERYSCGGLARAAHQAGRVPTTPTSASIVAALQVQEAMKLLHGDYSQAGRLIFFDGGSLRIRTLRIDPRPDCPGHRPYGKVIETPYGAGTTVREFLEGAEPHVGADPRLLLDRELVRALTCVRCRERERLHRPLDSVDAEQLGCPRCGTPRIPEVATRLGPRGGAADLPLRRLGIPPLHIVRVEGAAGRAAMELSADHLDVLPHGHNGEGPP